MLSVPLINIADINRADLVLEKMQNIQKNNISTVNWPELYPSKPEVAFKIAHNGNHIFLQFFVEENEILAKTAEDNGHVWTDSCVEFFISFDGLYYYNTEFSCIGKALMGYRKEKKDSRHASQQILDSIKRYPSLGIEPFDKKQGDFKWNLLLVIPATAYWMSDLKSLNGIKAHANFYKCGDNLTIPHFLSWNPIHTEKPNFHVPQFFGELNFE